ncbi:MAG: hypothetical protein MH204_06030 [Fimbriimonadaceae bacterium]|nr:hypothetical protein [Fimbriimonadaceae bacterium]
MGLTDQDLILALETVADRLGSEWPAELCLVGTAASRVQGVALPVRDIDLLTRSRAAVDRFAEAMEGLPCLHPPELLCGEVQYFCAFEVRGVSVEASTVEIPEDGDLSEVRGSGPWTHQVQVRVGRHTIPAVALELRLATELARGRTDRAEALTAWFREHGETELLRRVLAGVVSPPETASSPPESPR